jgi:hypothetical protein
LAKEDLNSRIESLPLTSANLDQYEECYVLGDVNNKFTHENLYTGKTGERVISSAVATQYKAKDGFTVRHNNFNSEYEFSCSSGLDVKLFEGCRELASFEVKNWQKQPKPYGTETTKEQILSRFDHCGGGIKILIITFMSLLTKEGIRLIEQAGILIFEIGELLTTAFYQDLKKLYSLGNRLKKAIQNFWQGKQCRPTFLVQQQIDSQITVKDSTVNLYTDIDKQHDTLLEEYRYYQLELIWNSLVLKQQETERLRKLYRKM